MLLKTVSTHILKEQMVLNLDFKLTYSCITFTCKSRFINFYNFST